MIKSNNIDNNTLFYNDDSLFTSKMSQYGIRAYCQKNIIKRLILKEDFDVESELRSLLSAQGAKFDTYIQENEEIYNYTNKISYYNEYIQRLLANKDIITTDDLTETDYVELNSKKYQPVFDFLYEDVRGIHIGKIKTSKFKNPLINNRDKNDMYILSLWAKRVYPNKPIFINFDYLIESKVSGDLPYERRRNQIEEEVTDELMEKLKESYEQQLETGCSPANCGSCDRNQLCNYEEPPINLGTERVIKPLSEIRLTQAQREVKDNEEGISRVIAGAGAGKTLVVAMRVVELIRKGYDPKKIAMLTYTTTGAKEMTDRVIRYLAGQEGILVDPTLITSGTINSFGQNILNEHFEELGYTAPPKVIPEEVRSGNDRLYLEKPDKNIINYNFAQDFNDIITDCYLTIVNNVFRNIDMDKIISSDNPEQVFCGYCSLYLKEVISSYYRGNISFHSYSKGVRKDVPMSTYTSKYSLNNNFLDNPYFNLIDEGFEIKDYDNDKLKLCSIFAYVYNIKFLTKIDVENSKMIDEIIDSKDISQQSKDDFIQILHENLLQKNKKMLSMSRKTKEIKLTKNNRMHLTKLIDNNPTKRFILSYLCNLNEKQLDEFIERFDVYNKMKDFCEKYDIPFRQNPYNIEYKEKESVWSTLVNRNELNFKEKNNIMKEITFDEQVTDLLMDEEMNKISNEEKELD